MRRALFLPFLLCCGMARAVILSGGDGSGNATGAGAGSGWDYVGSIGGASGVYLGDYGGSQWVLTAAHVGAGSFTLNNATYNYVPGTAVTLTNTDGTTVDLTLFRIDGNPGLTNLALSSSAPSLGAPVTMIGYGTDRQASETYWNVNWTETSNSFLGFYKGYRWSTTATKRWGTNIVTSTGVTEGTTRYFVTTFDRSAAGDAQATVGDSGGGVFVQNGSSWELAGIMGLVTKYAGQPDSASIYGVQTYSADISVYRSQILDIISKAIPVPEPRIWALLLMGWLAGGWRLLSKKAPAAPR
jgi:hypothetical protein